MSGNAQISRPYAKAVFDYALAQNQLDVWSNMLMILSQLSSVPGFNTLTTLPEVSISDSVDFIFEAVGQHLSEEGKNFVRILAENKRLGCLESLLDAFLQLRAEHDKSISAEVRSFSTISDAQREKLKAALKKRLNKDVSLTVTIDKSLLGGAVIQAGDMVIDGSIRGKLNKLEVQLQEA